MSADIDQWTPDRDSGFLPRVSVERAAPESNAARSRQGHASLYALLAIAMWGTLAICGLTLKHVPPFLVIGLGLIIGGLFGARGWRTRDKRSRVLLLGVYGVFAYHLCLFLALRLAPAIEANLLNYLWPLLLVLLTPLFHKDARLGTRHILGALLGFSGAALLVTGARFGFSTQHTTGYLLGFAAAVIWSTYSLLGKRVGNFTVSTVASFCLVSGLLALGCHFIFEPRYLPTLPDLAVIVPMGIGPMGAAFHLWARAMERGDPRVIGTLAYLTPLISTVLILVTGQGEFSATSGIAMIMIIAAAVIGSASSRGR